MRSPPIWKVSLILIIGVLSVSTTAIFIRLALQVSGKFGLEFSLFLAASRLTIASFLLLPAWPSVLKIKATPQAYYYAIAAGVALAFHFAFWITSLSFTNIVASTTLVTTNPIWVALFSWLWFKEKIEKVTVFGIIIALAGGVLITLGSSDGITPGSNPILGNILALMGAWLVSIYLILGKKAQTQGLTISSYTIIVYSTATLLLFPLPLIFGSGYLNYPKSVYIYVLLLAVFSQLIGHTSINFSVRYLSPILVTLALLFEPIGSSFMGFLLFQEVPSIPVLIGAMILLSGVAIAIVSYPQE
jgi:drug/metabolite transporter (DMT)-like permease